MIKYVKHSFLQETFNISFPRDWKIRHKDDNLVEIIFPFGPYPVLGCHLKCFDGPKINSEAKIKEYLLEGIKSQSIIRKLNDFTYLLKTNL